MFATFICFSRVTVSDVHQIIPRRDVFKVFSTERIEEEVRVPYDVSFKIKSEFCGNGY